MLNLRLLNQEWNDKITSDCKTNITLKWINIRNIIANLSDKDLDIKRQVYNLELAAQQLRNYKHLLNKTEIEIIMVEKLLYEILINQKLRQRAWREMIVWSLMEILVINVKKYPELELMQNIVSDTFHTIRGSGIGEIFYISI